MTLYVYYVDIFVVLFLFFFSVLFDPSCLYGDPDFDLIISAVETPLPEDFFGAYRKLRPAGPGYDKKMAVYRLFYYLILWCHVDNDDLKSNTLKSINDVCKLLTSIK